MDLNQVAQQLEASGDFKVLRRFEPVPCYLTVTPEIESKLRTIMVLDTETTGLDTKKDRLIELAYVQARFLPETGQIYDIISTYNGLQDPGMPIPEQSKRIHGIQDEDVAGKSLDRERVIADLAKTDLAIAHNASFDRRIMEAVFPEAASLWWACSNQEGPWQEMLTGSTKLEYLAYKLGGMFYDAHRALVDAQALLHILTLPAHDGRPILASIIERSRQPSYRIWAVNAPFDSKDYLKLERGYRWSDGTDPDSPIKAWNKDRLVGDAALEEEINALRANVYKVRGSVTVDNITGRERFTNRVRSRDQLVLDRPSGPTLRI